MSTKKPKEKTPGRDSGENPPAASTDEPGKENTVPGDAKDPFQEAAAKLETLEELAVNLEAGKKPEGVKITDAAEPPAPDISDVPRPGSAGQPEADKIIDATPGEGKKELPKGFTDADPQALLAWFSWIVPHGAGMLNKHRSYFMNNEIDGKIINPFRTAQRALVRFHDAFDQLAGIKGIKTE